MRVEDFGLFGLNGRRIIGGSVGGWRYCGLYCTVMGRGLDQWVRMGRWKMGTGMGMSMGMSERGEVK